MRGDLFRIGCFYWLKRAAGREQPSWREPVAGQKVHLQPATSRAPGPYLLLHTLLLHTFLSSCLTAISKAELSSGTLSLQDKRSFFRVRPLLPLHIPIAIAPLVKTRRRKEEGIIWNHQLHEARFRSGRAGRDSERVSLANIISGSRMS